MESTRNPEELILLKLLAFFFFFTNPNEKGVQWEKLKDLKDLVNIIERLKKIPKGNLNY